MRQKRLPAELATIIDPLVTLLETLEVQLFTVEQRLAALSAEEPVIAQLTTTPSVGRYGFTRSTAPGRVSQFPLPVLRR